MRACSSSSSMTSNSIKKEEMSARQICDKPGCSNHGFNQCGNCGKVSYCSKDCQTSHWKSGHKQICTILCDQSKISSKQLIDLDVKQLKCVIKGKCNESKIKLESDLDSKSKEELVTLGNSHCINSSDIQKYLSASTSWKPVESVAANNASNNKDKKKKVLTQQQRDFSDNMLRMAKVIRNDPRRARQMVPEFRDKSDVELRKMADEYEKIAKNPELMEQSLKAQEVMKDLKPEDRKQLEAVQQSLSGLGNGKTLTPELIDTIADTVKNKPSLVKSLFKAGGKAADNGIQADSTVDTVIDYVSTFDKSTIAWLITNANWLYTDARPVLVRYYMTLDKYTYGLAKYILSAVALAVLYVIFRVSWILVWTISKYIYRGIYGITQAAINYKVAEKAETVASTITPDGYVEVKDEFGL